ncbi:MAG: RloB family protein [bacterium]
MPKPKKQGHPLSLKPLFHIFCEGAKTEPNYLKSYIEKKFPGTTLIVVEKSEKSTAVQLVEEAREHKKRHAGIPNDVFWVVYDRENPTKYDDSLHAEARITARDNNINIALSNVCFEVWLLLHFRTSSAAYMNCADLLKNSDLKKIYIKDYDKADRRDYSDAEIKAARKNAKHMNQQTINGADSKWNNPHQWNPYTNVHELLDAIDAFGKEHVK